jgi:stage III sporulation protein AH
MKKIFKKNQLIITSLALMIAAAGYLNFSGRDISMVSEQVETASQSEEAADVSAPLEDSLSDEADLDESEIGEAVLTSASISSYVSEAKLDREQSHAKAKENLESIINNEALDESQKQEAVDQLARLSDRLEKQTSAEEMLGAKGFLNSVVTINDDTVDVLVANQDLSAVSKAQIEDVVSRTCGYDLNQIVITKMKISE